ncbi:MAG: vanadium-dependent haloperoxidase [Phycisphaerales bacterium]
MNESTRFRRGRCVGMVFGAVVMAFVTSAQAQLTEWAASGKVIRPGRYVHKIQKGDGTWQEVPGRGEEDWSIARRWNEELLFAIRRDNSRPTVHARNLYHTSAAMWDAWAAYATSPDQVFHHERQTAVDVQAAREEAISYAVYRIMKHRFANSPGAIAILADIDALMGELGYDINVTTLDGDTPAALGNRIADTIITFGMTDGSNEQNNYANQHYQPINDALIMDLPGNPEMVDCNRWQPLAINFFVDQSGNPIPFGYPAAISPEWGALPTFSLRPEDANVYERDGFNWWVYHDPGPPPYMGGSPQQQHYYKWGFEMVAMWSGLLDPSDGVMWDISPASFGNYGDPPSVDGFEAYYDRQNGGNASGGYVVNPVTGLPYTPQIVPRGDYARILAEFWADGPASETPPGHWFTIMNYVFDHPLFERRFMGQGPLVDPLEWDVKAYLLLGGAMHDTAVACWGAKGWYDFVRPVSAIRWMADRGQCTDPSKPHFNVFGLDLIPGFIEIVTPATTAAGQKHEHLAGHEGEIAIKAWRGPNAIANPQTDVAGVDWILADEWWPYQRPNFVSPPFPGYYSGHSTYSRTAAETLTLLTGSPYFPGGMGTFEAPQNEFLVFEDGPSVDCELQWAAYRDASDECSQSRIYGGIHPPCDDLPGRHNGVIIAPDVMAKARRVYNGQVSCPADFDGNRTMDFTDVFGFLVAFGSGDLIVDYAPPYRVLDFSDVLAFLVAFAGGCP